MTLYKALAVEKQTVKMTKRQIDTKKALKSKL